MLSSTLEQLMSAGVKSSYLTFFVTFLMVLVAILSYLASSLKEKEALIEKEREIKERENSANERVSKMRIQMNSLEGRLDEVKLSNAVLENLIRNGRSYTQAEIASIKVEGFDLTRAGENNKKIEMDELRKIAKSYLLESGKLEKDKKDIILAGQLNYQKFALPIILNIFKEIELQFNNKNIEEFVTFKNLYTVNWFNDLNNLSSRHDFYYEIQSKVKKEVFIQIIYNPPSWGERKNIIGTPPSKYAVLSPAELKIHFSGNKVQPIVFKLTDYSISFENLNENFDYNQMKLENNPELNLEMVKNIGNIVKALFAIFITESDIKS